MEAPSHAEIAARLEMATRSGLESSSLASYVFSSSEYSARDQATSSSLADLLPHLGPPDASRCPSCRVVLPFGSRSHLCLACNTSLLEPVLPSFTSSIAFHRLAKALHLDDLETDHVELDQQFSGSGMDLVSTPVQSGVDKWNAVSATSVPFRGGNQDMEERTMRVPLTDSISFSGVKGDLEQRAGVDKAHNSSIVDYAAKLEGILLEDFFSSQTNLETPVVANSDMFSGVTSTAVEPCVHENPWSIRMGSSSVCKDFEASVKGDTNVTEVVGAQDMVSGTEDDDSSWEGEFQSAAPASDLSFSFELGSSGKEPSTLGQFNEDIFGGFPTTSNVCGTVEQGNIGWPVDGYHSELHANTESRDDFLAFPSEGSCKESTDMSMDDVLFGLGWQQSEPPSMFPPTSESFPNEKSSMQGQRGLLEDLDSSSYQMAAPTSTNGSYDSGRDSNMVTWDDGFQWEERKEEKKKIVGSLLAQLHDISFMLADKLVIRTEEEAGFPYLISYCRGAHVVPQSCGREHIGT